MREDSPTIRLATAADLPAVVALLAQQFTDHGIALDPAALRRGAAGLIERPARGAILLAMAAGRPVRPVGLAALSYLWTLEHGGPAAWMDELYVLPTHRRAGLGRRLTVAALELARQAGALALDLEIEAGHDDAERLYRRLGFHRHDRVRWARPTMPIEPIE